MATKETATKTLTADMPKVMNAVRSVASPAYQSAVPYAYASADSVKEIGAIFSSNINIANEYIDTLVNLIARQYLLYKSYESPYKFTKKGLVPFGETIEQIAYDLIKVLDYDPADAANTLHKRELPDVKTAFQFVNYQKLYPLTIEWQTLRQAFLSWDSVNRFTNNLIDNMYRSMEYDEFLTTKYLISKAIIDGNVQTVTVSEPTTTEAAENLMIQIKTYSDNFKFMSTDYNQAGIPTFTERENQYVFANTNFNATNSVKVLAKAFNEDKVEFAGRWVLINGFSSLDKKRLNELFGSEEWYTAFTSEQYAILDTVYAVLVDEDWFMIFDQLLEFAENPNGKALSRNYFLHTWKSFGFSPFANAVAFTSTESTVTGVTVTPSAANASVGNTVNLSATVSGTGLYDKNVVWTVGPLDDGVTVTLEPNGNNCAVTVTGGAATKTATIYATSVSAPGQAGGSVITITA